jgi:hypothetical protein
MMARRVSMKIKRQEAPDWIFPWRPTGEPLFPKLLALAAVSVMFALMLSALRVRTVVASPWAGRKASVIQVLDDVDGRALTLRAREGGPFPSRFEPAEWPVFATLEKAALDAARAPLPPYVPALRELPPEITRSPALAEPGKVVLPTPTAPSPTAMVADHGPLKPRILPLSGINTASIPDELPAFSGEVTPSMAADAVRFLIRIDAAGYLTDCLSLDAGDEAGPSPLETWLRGIRFKPDPSKTTRWAAVRVAFTNPPAHGTIDR